MVDSKDKNPISTEYDDMFINNFETRFDDEINVICNVVSILRIEFDKVIEVTEEEDDFLTIEITYHKPLCYYIMSNGGVEEDNAFV